MIPASRATRRPKGRFSMKRYFAIFVIVGVVVSLGAYLSSSSAQQQQTGTFHGRKIIFPESSIPRPGHIHTIYYIVGSREFAPQPPSDAETPASLACVYQLVSGPTGCPIATSTNPPTGG